MDKRPGSLLAIAGLVLGAGLVGLQYIISMSAYGENGESIALATLRFFSYFTILTNILLVLIYLAALLRERAWLDLFRKPATLAMAAAAITLVMGFYHFFLAATWQPKGLFLVCDIGLHYLTPILFLIWFAVFNCSGTLSWSAVRTMIWPPLVYLAWVMGRGAVVNEYPYPVLDAGQLGYAQVGINLMALLVVLILLDLAAIAIDRSHNPSGGLSRS